VTAIEAMLAEWTWLTAEQQEDLRRLSKNLMYHDTTEALAKLSARGLRYAIENGQRAAPLVVVVAPPEWGNAQIEQSAELLSELGHEALVVPHGTVVHVIGRDTIDAGEVERLKALAPFKREAAP
jgi:hypothetical protein